MASYTMSAEDNYSSALAAQMDNGTLTTDLYFADQTAHGFAYDPVRRRLVYACVHRVNTSGSTTNTTGHTLWDGRTSIAPAGAWNQNVNALLFIATKDIDTGAVTFYDTYSAAQTVPAGIGGGDGTWRRFIREATFNGGNYPLVTDPRTGDIWQHTESCELYCFRASDNYVQTISPFFAVGDIGNLVFPIFLTDDWMYARQDGDLGVKTYHFIPRLLTADETAADELLAYASFDLPVTITADAQLSQVGDAGNSLYVSVVSNTGTPTTYTLYQLTPPTSAPYGDPVVGGGFTDITPWASNTGPNLDGLDYSSPGSISVRPVVLFDLREEGKIAQITKFSARHWSAGGDPPERTMLSCTYVDPVTGTFEHHSAFVSGYMKADWTVAAGISEAAYQFFDFREVNSYLNAHSYTFAETYAVRWLVFYTSEVVDGVAGDDRTVFVKYRFASGAAPQVLTVISEAGWREAYAAYTATYHEFDSIVSGVPDYVDDCVYDATSKAFWFSGANDPSLFFLNNAFPVRGALWPTVSSNAPFLKMSYTTPASGRGFTQIRYGDQ